MAEHSLSPQEFSQRKLEDMYRKTCSRLYPMREGIKLLQEAVLWRKPVLSVALYASVHFLFWNLYYLTDTGFSLLGRLLFWVLLVDGFLVIATRDRSVPMGNTTSSSRWRLRRKREQGNYVSFGKAVEKNSKPLEIGEVADFEVVCLWIAVSMMWTDNFQLAMRHWNREQPYMLTCLLFICGIIACVLGYFVYFVSLAYLIVLVILLWPVVSYYNVIARGTDAINTHYPIFTQKIHYYYDIAKRHFHRLPDDEFRDYQLEVATPAPPNRPPEPSMTLTPFEHNFNVMDSMGASLMLQPQGFHYPVDDSLTLPSFSQTRRQPHPHVSHPPQSLGGISEASNEEPSPTSPTNEDQFFDVSSASPLPSPPLPPPPVGGEDLQGSRSRADTLSLGPFGKNSSIHDSFDDILELTSGSGATGNGSRETHTQISEHSGLSPISSNSDGASGTGGGGAGQGESPYFSSKLGFPSLISSTPLNDNGTVRQRVLTKEEEKSGQD